MSSISVCKDTNCINAKKQDEYINALEKLAENGKILIGITETLEKELKRGGSYQLGLREAQKYIISYGETQGGNLFDQRNMMRKHKGVLEILWGNKTNYSPQEIDDAWGITTAHHHGETYFITYETNLLKKSQEIEKEFTIKIRKPKDCLEEVNKRIAILESRLE